MLWAMVTVAGMLAAFCIGREWDKPNLVKWDINRIYGEPTRGYRRW